MDKNKAGHSNALDALRGMAALSVIISHLFIVYYREFHDGISGKLPLALTIFNSPFSFFYRGSSAVMLFFVLSGYVLTAACVRNCIENSLYIPMAASKRYLRLGIPVACSVVLCYLLSKLGAFPPAPPTPYADLLDFPSSNLTFMEMVRSATYGSMLFGDKSFNYVLWTISLEFYGSLFIFATYSLMRSNRIVFVAVCLPLSLYLLVQPPSNFRYVYGLFLMGGMLAYVDFEALCKDRRIIGAIISILLLVGGCYFAGYYPNSLSYVWLIPITKIIMLWFPGSHPLVFVPSMGAVFIILSVLVGSAVRFDFRISDNFLLIWLGRLSFSIYLLHPIVIGSVGKAIFVGFGKSPQSLLVAIFVVTLITCIGSYFFYLVVDKNSIRLANSFSRLLYEKRYNN